MLPKLIANRVLIKKYVKSLVDKGYTARDAWKQAHVVFSQTIKPRSLTDILFR